ncbi:MAG: efflux transporter periplasmic adaptor subunit [Methylothermaceae bacteria B42]|nr:MAG: efflux transporter periplasmic adaptor subunit [Methylothermaceae bacteria B42]HHJ37951.1 efflux RND transporter periplasmic adaptor subunit [Methylothermaceae bacterium]
MPRLPLRPLLIILLSLAGIGGMVWYFTRPQPVPVRVHKVARGVVEQTVANTRVGTVKACQRSRLSTNIGGQIESLWVHEGDQVKKGQLLLSLWNRDLKAQVALAESEIETARATARAACLRAANARTEAARLRPLLKKQLISQELFDQTATEAKAKSQDCQAARATVAIRQARLRLAQAQLAKTVLYAPFDGVVAEVYGEVSEYITPSPPGVATPPAIDLIASGCFYVSAPIDEIDSAHLKPGLETRIHIDAFGKQHFPGRLRRIAPYVLEKEKQARTVEVEVNFVNPGDEKRQRAGYSADVEIILARRDGVLRIPTEAVKENQTVLIFNQDTSRLQARQIETGLSNWEWTEIKQGLKAGELVVISLDREGVKAGAPAVIEQDESS